MRLNNKGFAITAVLYGILILFVFTVSSYLIALSLRKDRATELTDDIAEEYYDIETRPKYAVVYNANGGSGAPSTQTKIEDIDLTLTLLEPTRDGYEFRGWGTSSDDTTVDYMPGSIYESNTAITLYAIWQRDVTVYTLVDYITDLYNGADKTTVTMEKEDYGSGETVSYNYASSVSLMNDRLGGYGDISSGRYYGPSLLSDYNAGNIRYYGTSPNNYIYFNCSDYSNQSDSTCEKWRIIGVMKEMELSDGTTSSLVKIVRDDSVMNVGYDNNRNDTGSLDDGHFYDSDWPLASLNTLLNNSYYNGDTSGSITYYSGTHGSEISNLNMSDIGIKNDVTRNFMQEVIWDLGMTMISSDSYPDETYVVERTYDSYGVSSIDDIGKVALIYASDYGFATDLSLCNQSIWSGAYNNTYPSDVDCINNNWLFTAAEEWILTRSSGGDISAMVIYGDGTVGSRGAYYKTPGIRPTLYLKHETMVNDLGNGSSSSPYQIVAS